MSTSKPMAERILDAAETRARIGGYNGFSFRELASDVGVKSASVHYHFPTKADLCERLARRYREATLAGLGDPDGLAPAEALRRVAQIFLDANETVDRMCLCGILGAEADVVPESVVTEVSRYFTDLRNWLRAALGPEHAGLDAGTLVGALEGSLLISRTQRDPSVLRRAVEDLAARV